MHHPNWLFRTNQEEWFRRTWSCDEKLPTNLTNGCLLFICTCHQHWHHTEQNVKVPALFIDEVPVLNTLPSELLHLCASFHHPLKLQAKYPQREVSRRSYVEFLTHRLAFGGVQKELWGTKAFAFSVHKTKCTPLYAQLHETVPVLA